MLVVEDDAEISSKLTRIVEIVGGQPFPVATRCALREAIAAHMPFDLVVTEGVMAWITGVGVLHACLFEQQPPIVFVVPGELDLRAPLSGPWFRLIRKPLVAEDCIATFTDLLSDATRSGVHRVHI